jgi:general stress protein 26
MTAGRRVGAPDPRDARRLLSNQHADHGQAVRNCLGFSRVDRKSSPRRKGSAMSHLSLQDLARKMKGIDIATLATKTHGGEIASRPMSNNGDVEYDGDNWYFTQEDARTVGEIERDPRVSLAFQGKHHFYATVEGEAELVRDKAAFEEHWNKDLEMWFKDGVDTPGLVLIKVHAKRIKYWDGMKGEGELVI